MKQLATRDLIGALTTLGLREHESQVYLALLEIGATHVGPVVAKTGLHRQFVYSALEKLESSGYVAHVLKRNRKFFQPSDPSIILQHQRERERQAENLIPHLMQLVHGRTDRINVRVLFGKEEFFKNLETIALSASRGDKLMRIIGGGDDRVFYSLLGRKYDDYLRITEELGVKKRLLGVAKAIGRINKHFKKEGDSSVRVLPAGLSSPTYTRVTNELTSIEIYGSEVIIIQIWNAPVAKGFIEHFDLLWRRALPMK